MVMRETKRQYLGRVAYAEYELARLQAGSHTWEGWNAIRWMREELAEIVAELKHYDIDEVIPPQAKGCFGPISQ